MNRIYSFDPVFTSTVPIYTLMTYLGEAVYYAFGTYHRIEPINFALSPDFYTSYYSVHPDVPYLAWKVVQERTANTFYVYVYQYTDCGGNWPEMIEKIRNTNNQFPYWIIGKAIDYIQNNYNRRGIIYNIWKVLE